MTDHGIAAPLSAALTAKGYDRLTPVQEAMLAPDVGGRDLLVSAQTGSGKTVAFGIAIAPELLAGNDRLLFADVPMALIVAPTRELALQVAREFEWLYAETGAQVATCVGGMDFRSERRALERGAHVVVGTPGRLRDHIERGTLDLSGLRAVVLDEADEMLDLGFREDLEFILSSAPETRRTLMFSATVPRAIAELAKDFQRDALRVQTAGEARQHVDIAYRALSVAARDREHAIFNVLRFYEARTAIVFCKTRANVNHLLARMGNRGFQVVALSGELSQQERTHALQALRNGRARVCIATDVAARGIDLPGLDLVIHADLPSNPEVLLHRSGRTGRAGQKGVSALIVVPSEFRKAQRLLQGAKVVAEWGAAPSADEVRARDDARLMEHPALLAAPGEEAAIGQALLDRFGAAAVAAAFVRLTREGRSAPEEIEDTQAPSAAPAAPRERGEFGDSVWYELSVGRTGRAEARWLLPKICDAGGIAKDGIGAIRVQAERTFVQIATAAAGRFGEGVELEPGLSMRRIAGEPDLERPERAAPRRTERAERPSAPRPPRDEAPVRPAKPAYSPKPPRVVEDAAAAPAIERPDVTERPRPRAAKPEGARPAGKYDRKPFGAGAPARDGKPGAPRKPFDKTGKPPRKDDGDRKPYARKAEGAPRAEADERKPRWKGEAGKSAGYKSHGGGEGKPARSAGYKSHAAEGKPARSGPGAKPGRAAGFKSHAAKPAPAPQDARDTSKRFVPPKKPKA